MTPADDGLPALGPTARQLGLRRQVDVTCDSNDIVLQGGMSVAPETPWNLPPHRRPRRLGRASTGPDKDGVFEIAEGDIEREELAITRDADHHALVHGNGPCRFGELTERIERTRPSWRQWAEDGDRP
jgi:hypothetical protein